MRSNRPEKPKRKQPPARRAEPGLGFAVERQPDDVTCGPACLHGIYRYYGDALPLATVIADLGMLDGGAGTFDVFLANHALRRGYRATLFTYNLQLFDPTWFDLPPEEIRALQEKRFLQQMARGWEVPFYQRHWRAAGLEPGDIRSLDDLKKIPPYTVHDLRESIERAPPFGDYMGIRLGEFPLVLQTSGGTTGLPRPMLYSPRDREVTNILGGRRFISLKERGLGFK